MNRSEGQITSVDHDYLAQINFIKTWKWTTLLKDIKGFSLIDNHTEFSPQGKIPTLWQKFDNSIPVVYKGGEKMVYGVYFNYESDQSETLFRVGWV